MIGLAIIGGLIGLIILSWVIWFFATFTTFSSPKDGLQILHPRNWVVRAHPNKDVVVAFVSPKETALDPFLENYNFSKYDMAKEPELQSTDAYADKIVQQMAATFNDLKLVQKSVFPVAGKKGYKMVFRATSKVQLLIVLYVFTIEDMGYNMLYLGAFDRFSKDSPMLDLVALTMKVKY
ncbi:MAG: hypothetical protein HQL17_07305 [Candidatus Omnitrophica bacterium]|nr:hypothetical protein [Candidatus Omnitrophota bacterium]